MPSEQKLFGQMPFEGGSNWKEQAVNIILQ
jgi:hypothetical protein